GAQAINSSNFQGDRIKSVTTATEVFGRSQRTTTTIIEYDTPIGHDAVKPGSSTVAGRTITRAYIDDHPEKASQGRGGLSGC
ncbi:MAG: hypothetical protein QM636_13860, partial [Rhizobium sp.]